MSGLVGIAVFTWFIATLASFMFATDLSEPFLKRVCSSIRMDIRRSAGLKAIPSMLQAASIYWIILGMVLNWVSETLFEGFVGNVFIAILVGIPLFFFAKYSERR